MNGRTELSLRGSEPRRARPSTLRGAAALLALATLATTGSSCLFVLDRSTVQCDTTQDCVDRGGAFANHICSDDSVCVPVGGGACQSTAECTLPGSSELFACLSGQCVQLTSQDCREVVPSSVVGEDNVVYLGWMGPLVGEFASIGIPIKQAVELALREVEQITNGVPAPGGGRRKLAIVACHDLDDPARVANHLVGNVQVPLIFGPAFSGVTIETATDITVPAGVMLFSASATSPNITDLPDDGLVWRTCPSDAIQAIPLSLLVDEAETQIREELMLSPIDKIRIATATKGDAYGLGLQAALQPILNFNNQDLVSNESQGNYLGVQYDDPQQNPDFDYSEIVTQIVALEPHIVLPLGTNEGITKIMQGVEDAWPTTGTPPPRPLYLFPDGGRLQELLDATLADAGSAEPLRERVRGTVPGRKGPNYDAFALRYRQVWNADPGTFAENGYDAAYLTAFSLVSIGDAPVTGAALANGMTKMSEGAVVVAGPNNLNAGYNLLTGGATIDYDGASGPLQFNNATGEAPSDIDLWCVVEDQATGEDTFLSSGRYYDATTQQLVGVDLCNQRGG